MVMTTTTMMMMMMMMTMTMPRWWWWGSADDGDYDGLETVKAGRPSIDLADHDLIEWHFNFSLSVPHHLSEASHDIFGSNKDWPKEAQVSLVHLPVTFNLQVSPGSRTCPSPVPCISRYGSDHLTGGGLPLLTSPPCGPGGQVQRCCWPTDLEQILPSITGTDPC